MGVCNCSMFCCTLLYVHSSIAIILMGKRELIALLNLSSWCLVMVGRLFLTVPRCCLQFVIVVFPDHTHLLLFMVSYTQQFKHKNNQKVSTDFAAICTQVTSSWASRYSAVKLMTNSGFHWKSSSDFSIACTVCKKVQKYNDAFSKSSSIYFQCNVCVLFSCICFVKNNPSSWENNMW